MRTSRKPPEAVSGSYTPIPHAVLDSTAFLVCSTRAKAMLFDVLRQHTGRNNGHLQLSLAWLKKRGWTSADQVQKGKTELLARNILVKTREGGLTTGPDLYALTWLPISDFHGLDIGPGQYHPGAWRFQDPLPTVKKHSPSSVSRNNTVPPHGTGEKPIAPPHGTIERTSTDPPIPPHGNNECCQFPPKKMRSRVVGKKGKSGTNASCDPGGRVPPVTKP